MSTAQPLPLLFSPIELRGVTARNRVVVSPMCQYSSADGGPTSRYFVEKYPIFVGLNDPVTFCFVDEGLVTPSHFETFLANYERLFRALPAFHLVYVAARPLPFRWAETIFQKHVETATVWQTKIDDGQVESLIG